MFLLDGQVKTKKNTPHHPRFCLDSDLDTDDFANMALFIDEVSRTVTTTFKLKNTLDNGIGIVAAASMFSGYESTESIIGYERERQLDGKRFTIHRFGESLSRCLRQACVLVELHQFSWTRTSLCWLGESWVCWFGESS